MFFHVFNWFWLDAYARHLAFVIFCFFLFFTLPYIAAETFGTFISITFSTFPSVGTQMSLSRYLFALSCFQMDLLNEAEAALCAPNEPNAEVGGVFIIVYLIWDRIDCKHIFLCSSSSSSLFFLCIMDKIVILAISICFKEALSCLCIHIISIVRWHSPMILLFSFLCRFQMVQLVITFLGLFTGYWRIFSVSMRKTY